MVRIPAPIIYTEHTIMRPPRLRDAWQIERAFHDPGMRRFVRSSPRQYPGLGLVFVLRSIVGRWLGRRVDYLILHRETGELIGARSAFRISLRPPSSAEMGLWVTPKFRRTGLRREGGDAFTLYMFGVLKVHRESWAFDVNNTPIAKRAGKGKRESTFEGVLRDHICRDGTFYDMHQWSLLRTDPKVVELLEDAGYEV